MKLIFSFFILIALTASCSPNIHSTYYTSGAGYNSQVIGAKCSQCGRQMNLSWNQYNNVENISCPYCGGLTNTKQACSVFKYDSDQQSAQALGNALVNVSKSYQDQQATKNQSTPATPPPSSNSCQYKTYTIFSNGKTMFCTQYSSCTVQCY